MWGVGLTPVIPAHGRLKLSTSLSEEFSKKLIAGILALSSPGTQVLLALTKTKVVSGSGSWKSDDALMYSGHSDLLNTLS